MAILSLRRRRRANARKVGHLGSLDPMAAGVLPLVAGRATAWPSSGFEYQAAVRLMYEGMLKQGVEVIEAIRGRCAVRFQ